MSESTHIRDEIDLEGSDPATRTAQPVSTRPAFATRRPKTRRLRVLGLVIAATVAGSAATHWLDPPSRRYNPPWTATCQDAIDATAHLHRLQGTQLAHGMAEAFALIAGVDIPNPNSVDTSLKLNARLQRKADNATSRCVSPTPPHL